MSSGFSLVRWRFKAAGIWFLALGLFPLIGTTAQAADDPVDYLKQIKPILRERCFACHGALKQNGGLRLDSAALVTQGGDSGAAIEPGKPEGSLLLTRVSATDLAERMPPEGEPLKPEQIAALKAWIAQNAPAPADEQPERNPRDHWSFNPPQRLAVPWLDQPTPEQALWQANPIDAFIGAAHRQHGLAHASEADRPVWLRRVTYDLIGLPPTVDELNTFLADASPDAHDKVVTRLLDSAQYGQRWGRHWMDVWRYSDWWGLGEEVRNSQKHMWHWRDWIIESLNSDKGYDQMLREMLAADELYPNDLDKLRATGYLVRPYFIFNRTTWLDETIEHTAKGMLGLTFNCAKCHDHKYDPLAQVEYYELRAIFEPYQLRTEMVPGQADFEKDGIPRVFDAHLDVPTYLHIRGDDRNPDQSRSLAPSVPAFLSPPGWKLAPQLVTLPAEATNPGLREFVVHALRQAAEDRIATARAALEALKTPAAAPAGAAAGTAAAAPPPSPEQTLLETTIAEKVLRVAETQLASIEARAQADRAATANSADRSMLALAASRSERVAAVSRAEEEVSRAELALLLAAADKKAEPEMKLAAAKTALEMALGAMETPSETYAPLPGSKKTQEDYQNRNADSPYPTASSGRRTAFANWLTDRRHPLAARVAINHIWMRHMGKPLVPTVFDFGRKGAAPTHPELLDWLAVELMDHDWSMKHIHRLIVTSRAYRMSSSSAEASPETLAHDPDNRFYWRMNPVRAESQVVRDSLLYLANELDLSLGGPSIAIQDETSRRRSLYFVHSYNDHQPFLAAFDDANVLDCYRRAESIVPQQALALENSSLVAAMASKIMQRVVASSSANDVDFVRGAFTTILSVEPTAEELTSMVDVLRRMVELAKAKNRPDPDAFARTNLVRTILNHNDFITIR